MIARTWTGEVRTEDADAYEAYLNETGFAGYLSTPGNHGVAMLRRELGETTEFVMFTLWQSLDAVKAFAGEDPDIAVYYPEDDRFLVRRDANAVHYSVARQSGFGSAA
ncbi:MAG TPA: antibiotic biosynthesis monooxygenase [Gaiellales bacterium]|jgi:heme-degrading monooxygenase HmoA